jgi:ParB/RepB/Spo0J family partition protein
MDDRSKPVEAASSSGFRNDHCTELEHSENIVASAQAQSRGSSAFHVRNVGLTAIAVLPDRMRGLRREVVNALAESMKAQGVLQPIILRRSEAPGFLLVAGHHRLEAARGLGWHSIPARLIEAPEADFALLAEIDENLVRADLSAAERALHIGRRKEIYERTHPETAHGAVGRGGKSRKLCDTKDRFTKDTAKKTGQSERKVQLDTARAKLDVLADIVGTCLDKGVEIDALAKLPPAVQRNLADRAKAGERVSAKVEAKREHRARLERELGNKQQALPQKKYGVILADPEWKHVPWSPSGMDRAADNHYPTSPTEVIASRPVESIAAKHSILFLWAVVPMLPDALRVMEAWGFTYRTNGVWCKQRPGRQMGLGYWFRIDHEILLVGTRGEPPAPAQGTQWRSVIEAPVGAHSAKPECVLELIEAYFPTLPKIELNRRGPPRAGWDAWGNEIVSAATPKMNGEGEEA